MNERESKIFDHVLGILKKELNPSRIILFGSRSKESSTASSDFDFAVACERVNDSLKRTVREAVEKVNGLYGVDIVYLSEVDDDFKEIIMKTGKVIYEAGT